MENCYAYLKQRKAMRNNDYPYLGYKSTCKYIMNKGVNSYISGFVNIPKNNSAAMMKALASQPVVAAVDASQQIYQFYKGGIISSTTCGTSLNHAINLIGYGTDASGV